MTQIVFYSWSGKTKHCADIAARLLGSSPREIVETIPRKKSILGFLKSGYQASKEKVSEIHPIGTLEGDQLVLAFPIWAGKMPPAINSALAQIDFTNKRVLVINTMGGESKTIPSNQLTRDIIVQRGGTVVGFVAIVTSRSVPEALEMQVKAALEHYGFIG